MSQLCAGGADAKMSDEATKGAAKVVSNCEFEVAESNAVEFEKAEGFEMAAVF